MKIKSLCALSFYFASVSAQALAADSPAATATAPAPVASAPAPASSGSAAAPAASPQAASGSGRGFRGGRGGFGAPMTPAETAEVAKLKDLPAYSPSLADGDYSIGPDYVVAPEETVRPNVPQGKVIKFTMDSKDSKFYPGIAQRAPGEVVPYVRQLTLYIPSQYVPGTPVPFIVSADAYRTELPTILDNMIADHRLPVMVAVMILPGGSVPGARNEDGPGSERGLEYDTVSGKYAEFVEAEVLPRITKDYGVTFSKDPDARMTLGGSSGGAVSFSMAWFHPELYHRALIYSGTFVNQQSPVNPDILHGAWEYHDHIIQQSAPKPLRLWLEVGENDNSSTAAGSGFHNWLIANERMAAVLKAKGYHYQLVYAKGAGHTDKNVINQTLPQALEWVWKGYPVESAKDAKGVLVSGSSAAASPVPAAAK